MPIVKLHFVLWGVGTTVARLLQCCMGSSAFLVGEGRETWRAYCERSFCFGCGYNSHKTFAMLYGSYAFLVLGRRGETHACLDCAMQLLFQLARLAKCFFVMWWEAGESIGMRRLCGHSLLGELKCQWLILFFNATYFALL